MRKPRNSLLDRLASKAVERDPSGRAHGRRSPLTIWLTKHRDEFAAIVEGEEPNWEAMAAEFAADGIMAGNGTITPDGDRLRKTWWTVNRKYKQAKERRAAAASRFAAAPPPPVPSAPADGTVQENDDPPPKRTFKFASRPK